MTTSNPWVSKFASPLLGMPNVHQAAHGGVAERAEHMMGAPMFGHGTERIEHVAGGHQVGLTTVADVESAYATVDAQMEATNTAVQACSAMSQTDVTTWNGQYAAWQAIKSDYQGYHSTVLRWASLGTVTLAYILKLSWFQDRFTSFQQQIPVWQQKIQLACPNYAPPPSPAPTPGGQPPAQPSWVCTNLGINCPKSPSDDGGAAWSTTILVVAVAVAVVAGFWFFAPVMGAFVAGRRISQAGADHLVPESRRLGA